MADQCVLWQEGLLCREHGGDTRRQASTPGDMEGAVGGQQPSSRAAICSFVQGGTGGVQQTLQECNRMTSSRPLMCMFLLRLSETVRLHEGGMRARRPQVGPVVNSPTPCTPICICQRIPGLADSPLVPCTLHG